MAFRYRRNRRARRYVSRNRAPRTRTRVPQSMRDALKHWKWAFGGLVIVGLIAFWKGMLVWTGIKK